MSHFESQESLINSVNGNLTEPDFIHDIFQKIVFQHAKSVASDRHIDAIVSEVFFNLSQDLNHSEVQEACTVRNVLISRQLAQCLIGEKGEFREELLPYLIDQWTKQLYLIGPGLQYDGMRRHHILRVLEKLHNNKMIVQLIKRFTKPTHNRLAENLVRSSLLLPQNIAISDAHARQAVLSALFCYLRQNIGSCFATAPAEIIHDEQTELFLQDLMDLMTLGRLRRTFGGIEHSVPLSASWGNGDLRKPMAIRVINGQLKPEIWRSPGLIAGLQATEVFLEKKEAEISRLIQEKMSRLMEAGFVEFITVESLLQVMLLEAFNLTQEQVQDYRNRPKGIFGSESSISPAVFSKEKSTLTQRCVGYLANLESAKNTFKGFSDIALLKAWEFTLASFCENKLEFTKWNLYSSLGLASVEPGGIGECLFNHIQYQLNQIHHKLEELQLDYETAHRYLEMSEGRLKAVSSEQEAQWARLEYQNRWNEFKQIEQTKIKEQEKSKAWVEMHDLLHKVYMNLFKDYFQEVYDADTKSDVVTRFDDSPAGFRLVYKHGRSNTALWTWIHTPTEFIDALSSFFSATEDFIVEEMDFKDMQREFSDLMTTLLQHIKTERFLVTAFDRMASAHHTRPINDPLENLDKIDKKPWAYTSGGTMDTLIQCYYKLIDKPKEEGKWVETEVELLVFLVDCIKQMAPNLIRPFLLNQRSSILMQSPTHAFLLKPNLPQFKKLWSNDSFTYTFVRDSYIKPATAFIENIELTDEMVHHLLQLLSEKIQDDFRHRFKDLFRYVHGPMNPIEFRNRLLEYIEEDRGLRFSHDLRQFADIIDSCLFSTLPLFPNHELRSKLKQIFSSIPDLNAQQIDTLLLLFDTIPTPKGRFLVGSDQLQQIGIMLISLMNLSPFSDCDWYQVISEKTQELGFAMPPPLIFADTNWFKDYFAFLVSPGSGKLELWRVDYAGRVGYPMSMWKMWLDGSRPHIKWHVYHHPYQYGQA